MAIFYKYIKGSNETMLNWSYIEWGSDVTSTDALASFLPSISISSSNSYKDAVHFGKIITSLASGQSLPKDITAYKLSNNESYLDFNYVDSTSTKSYVNLYAKSMVSIDSADKVAIVSPTAEINSDCTIDKNLTVSKDLISNNSLTINNGSIKTAINSEITTNAPIISTNYVQATYFTATSDLRAKDIISPLDPLTCLNIVRSIPIYSYTYKSNPNEVEIGAIAQDLEIFDSKNYFNGFNFVKDNNSNGIDKFKSLKESKLIYLLWGSIQQMQTEIEILKAELYRGK